MSNNKFEKPKELTDHHAICMYIMRLLLLNPGTLESHPNMGIGIVSKWRFSDETCIENLKLEIQKQLTMYLPKFQFVKVELTLVRSELIIEVNIDNILYTFKTDDGDLKIYEV